MLSVMALALLILAAAFWWLSENLPRGFYWADQICSQAGVLCQHPSSRLIVAAACVVLALAQRCCGGEEGSRVLIRTCATVQVMRTRSTPLVVFAS
jgi:hypothetical protein